MIVTRRPGLAALEADRARIGLHIIKAFDSLQLDGEDGGRPLGVLGPRLTAMVDQLLRLDQRIAELKASGGLSRGPHEELRDARAAMKSLAVALAALEPGEHAAARHLAEAVVAELRRAGRARRELDKYS